MDSMQQLFEAQRPLAQTLIKACKISASNSEALMELLRECVIEADFSKLTQQGDLASTDEDSDKWSASKSELKELIKHIKNYQEALSALDNPGVQKRCAIGRHGPD